MSETRFCNTCQKRTDTVFNDFMVAFCAVCKTLRGTEANYAGQKQPFMCIFCGSMMDESYVGQQICSDCKYEDQEEL